MDDDVDGPASLDGPEIHHVYHGADDQGTLSTTVIEAVAAVEGVDPSRTRIPLRRSVDPDALDDLFQRGSEGAGEGGYVVFPVLHYTVVVHADGNIYVYDDEPSVDDRRR